MNFIIFWCAYSLLTVSRKAQLPVYFGCHKNVFQFHQLMNIKFQMIYLLF